MTTPLNIALIGCGRRAQRVYFQVLPALAEWVRVVAVCDPVPSNRDVAAAHFGAPAFDSLRALLRAKPMAAALVATPPSSLRVQLGFDPLDIETVAYYAFPKP